MKDDATASLSAESGAFRFFRENDLMAIGVYYYPEHWNPSEWERDLDAMVRLGFEFVHMAEFAWAEMEPRDGGFDFDWLDRVLELCRARGLRVVLGTPSAAIPAWLGMAHPEVYATGSRYLRAEHGTRAQGAQCSPVFRRYVSRIVEEMGSRYGSHPAVWGWQIDNEPEAKADFGDDAQAAFRSWLKERHGSIAALNKAWGASFWSQSYSDFSEVKIPNPDLAGWWGTNPHALLDHKRFLADTQARFLDGQAAILRSRVVPGQFVTSNFTGFSPVADYRRSSRLDFPTFTAYPGTGSENIGGLGFRLGNPQVLNWALAFYRSLSAPMGVMELQPGQVNWGDVNPRLLPGTVRMWLWHCLSLGCRLACTYRYRQVNYGAEQYHGAIVLPDGVTPSPGGREFAQAIAEVKKLRGRLGKPRSPHRAEGPKGATGLKTGILWSYENFWNVERQSQNIHWNTRSFIQGWQEAALSAGSLVDFRQEGDRLDDLDVLVVPAYELSDMALARTLETLASGGTQVILTVRCGIKTRLGELHRGPWGGALAGLAGLSLDGYDQLPPNRPGLIRFADFFHGFSGREFAWDAWADLIGEPGAGVQIWARHASQFYAGAPAVTYRAIGTGGVAWVGVASHGGLVEAATLRELLSRRAGGKSGKEDPFPVLDGAEPATLPSYPAGLYVHRRSGFGFAVNYGSETLTLILPAGSELVIGTAGRLEEKGRPAVILPPAGVAVWE